MTRAAHPSEYELAASLLPGPDWKSARVEEGGQFHLVLIAPGEAVLRISRTPEAATDMQRRVDLVQALENSFTFELPTALSEVFHGNDFSAVVQRYIPGRAHSPHSGEASTLRGIIEELASVNLAKITGLLAEPFAFGGPWNEEKTQATLRLLPSGLANEAHLILQAVATFADVTPSLVHGDLAGHNLHWDDGALIGILDWDLAAAWDPALNTAYLSMWHGSALIEQLAPTPDEAWRARVWLGAMGLESLHDASLSPRRDLTTLLEKIQPRLLAAATAARG
ncbi:MAG: aminoglycoside phosphotransferase family protein [Paeniglutamicibacter terrestris]